MLETILEISLALFILWIVGDYLVDLYRDIDSKKKDKVDSRRLPKSRPPKVRISENSLFNKQLSTLSITEQKLLGLLRGDQNAVKELYKTEIYKSYYDYLKSEEWDYKRKYVLTRDRHTCAQCGAQDTELHVHHISYAFIYDEELNGYKDLVTLCKTCHMSKHN